MSNPKQRDPNTKNTADAPYNFVPLPEKVVTVKINDIPSHATYNLELYSGYLDCTLTTLTPTYTRCAQTLDFFREFADKPQDIRLKKEDRHQYAQFFHLDNVQRPVIPGSSLRGMLRSLVEIASYSKMQWVTNTLLAYRSIAGTDSLKDFYNKFLLKYEGKRRVSKPDGSGKINAHHSTLLIDAGFLEHKNGTWFIRPAQTVNGSTFARINHEDIPKENLPSWHNCKNASKIWVTLDTYDYQPLKGGYVQLKYVPVLDAKPILTDEYQPGILATSGHMDKKKHEVVIFPPDTDAELIQIPEKLIEAYQEQISPEQKNHLGDNGALNNHQPVFYRMLTHNGEKRLLFFGHTMLFRLVYDHTPLDLVPTKLRKETDIDIAEAIFGYAKSNKIEMGKKRTCAGRVFVTDAHYQADKEGIWLEAGEDGIITPQILAGPKPTAFQLYLVQDKEQGHDPDNPKQLAHYGTPTPTETIVRGHKLYWHKNKTLTDETLTDETLTDETLTNETLTIKDFQEKADKDPDKNSDGWKSDTQHTQIRPVKEQVTFQFKIHFENLHDYELGALLWVLDLPSNCRHKIGMGKPLGLGTVHIQSKLVLTNLKNRYNQLFTENSWHTGNEPIPNLATFKTEFETNMQKCLGYSGTFTDQKRIQDLLTLLKYPGPDMAKTNYMALKDYRERDVLPTPPQVDGIPERRKSNGSPKNTRNQSSQKTQKSSIQKKPEQEKSSQKPTHSIGMVVTLKIEAVWNKGRKKMQGKMPDGELALFNFSKKQVKPLEGKTIELVVSDFKNGFYYLDKI